MDYDKIISKFGHFFKSFFRYEGAGMSRAARAPVFRRAGPVFRSQLTGIGLKDREKSATIKNGDARKGK